MKFSIVRLRHVLFSGLVVPVILFSGLSQVIAAGNGDNPGGPADTDESPLAAWWGGKTMTGNWLGARDRLDEIGLSFNGKYYGAYFGEVAGQKGARGFWDQGLEFGAEQNFGTLLGVSQMKGVKGFANFRWRDPRSAADPNAFVEAASMFNPSNWISGTQFRVLNFGLEIGSSDLLPVKDMVVLRGGWIQPQKEFIDQPLSKLFLNNAVNSSKGVGGNIPFSSSATTWGGSLKLKPVEWYYAKAALFMAFPNMTATSNHGVAFEGFAQDPSQNGVWFMGETGVTPKLGPSELPGKYAFGGYYYGARADSFNGTSNYGQFGFYWQFDQMLFREISPELPAPGGKGPSDGKAVAGRKDFKGPVSMEKPVLSKQGLSTFNLISVSPKYNNQFPFYFHSGLVYQGLIPHRDDDLTMFAIAYGSYSYYKLLEDRENGRSTANYTIFLEWAYRIQLNQWAFFQPFVQCVIRPNGTDDVRNSTLLGFYTGVTF